MDSETKRIRNHLIGVIKNAKAFSRPFQHFYLAGCFPKDVYARLLDSLPDPTLHQDLRHIDAVQPDGSSTRTVFYLMRENFRKLDRERRLFWRRITDALSSPALKDAIFSKFSSDLAARFQADKAAIRKLKAFPLVALFRDAARYKINVHPDTPLKLVTMQFYLPSDLSQLDMGTSIYRRREPASADGAARHSFVKVKRFAFKPNSGYGFPVSKTSWHGRDELPPDAKVRRSLMLIYFKTPQKRYI